MPERGISGIARQRERGSAATDAKDDSWTFLTVQQVLVKRLTS